MDERQVSGIRDKKKGISLFCSVKRKENDTEELSKALGKHF